MYSSLTISSQFLGTLVQAAVIQYHSNANIHNIGQWEATQSIRGLNVVAVRHMAIQMTKLPLQHGLER